MCKFFSFVGDGYGNYYYSDWGIRKNNLQADTDSHTWILTRNKVPPKMQDRFSKYEYNPLTKKFVVDNLVEGHDANDAEAWANKLDFKKVVEPLIIKKIKNPLAGKVKIVTENEITLLKQWASVGYSVRASVWDSVGYSVRALVWYSVWYSVWDSVWDSVWYSVRDSVRASVRDSVWNSVRDSVGAYVSSFFIIQYKNDFSSSVKLWEKGFVPSFDGKMWRLHSGKVAKVVYEIAK
jgi:hypothetical protein